MRLQYLPIIYLSQLIFRTQKIMQCCNCKTIFWYLSIKLCETCLFFITQYSLLYVFQQFSANANYNRLLLNFNIIAATFLVVPYNFNYLFVNRNIKVSTRTNVLRVHVERRYLSVFDQHSAECVDARAAACYAIQIGHALSVVNRKHVKLKAAARDNRTLPWTHAYTSIRSDR